MSPVSSKSRELCQFFVCQGDAKSQFWNPETLLKFRDFLLWPLSIYIPRKKMLYSNMGSKMTPSLISEGGGLWGPPIKKFWLTKIFVEKIFFYPQKILLQNCFGPKKNWGQKNLGSKTILILKYLGPTNFKCKKRSKDLGQKNFVAKKF